MHVLWIADRIEGGGAEGYVRETPRRLAPHGIRSTLLYGVEQRMTPALAAGFDGVFPIADLHRQIRAISPDAIYINKAPPGVIESLCDRIIPSIPSIPTIRFLHDHAMFCLREHKYTLAGKEPCARPIGLHCYACTGPIRRDSATRSLRLATLGPLREGIRRLARHDALVVGSAYMAGHVAEHGIARDRIHVAPLFGPPAAATPASRREPGVFLFVGALTTGKGVDVLLDAVPRTTLLRELILVGDGPQASDLRARAAALRLGDRVTFAGPLERPALASLYARAAAVVLPARQPETFGLVGVEAMAHGVPVIATAIGGATEWLADGQTGLAVPANDPAALASAMDRIADGDYGARLGAGARAAYAARFTPERHAARLAEILSHAAVRRRAA